MPPQICDFYLTWQESQSCNFNNTAGNILKFTPSKIAMPAHESVTTQTLQRIPVQSMVWQCIWKMTPFKIGGHSMSFLFASKWIQEKPSQEGRHIYSCQSLLLQRLHTSKMKTENFRWPPPASPGSSHDVSSFLLALEYTGFIFTFSIMLLPS